MDFLLAVLAILALANVSSANVLKCSANSHFNECGSACPATCETFLSSSHLSCIEECVPQCVCDEGYVMYNGECVMKQKCAAKLEMGKCGANAKFEECGSACPSTCVTLLYGSNVVCIEQCVPSCVCNEGYVIQNGNCVMKQACVAKETPVCGAHSTFEECGSACPTTCETMLSSSHVSCIEECVPQCVCDEGYVMYNDNCVMKQECAAKLEMPQCGANARFEECGSACPTTCDTLLYGSNVVCTEQCVPSCVCNEGYVMQNGNCVMKQACVAKETPVCGAHSKFEECGSACPTTCETLLFGSHVSCIEECVPQCVCDEGFVTYNGECVMKQECAVKLEMPQCGANARFEECGSACPTTCDTLLYGSNVVCTEQCVPSCVCNEGYVMQNGNCVMKQACVAKETPVCGANSKFEECGSACPATCETLLSSSHVSCIEECVPQCVCDEGYVMYNGECVMKQECAAKLEMPQCGANARFEECGSAFPTTCDTLLYGSNVVCTQQCVPSCVCNEGYVMQNGNCIMKQACVAKETPVCGAHSKFEECGSACQATCETLLFGSHVSCIEECVPQCVCDEGYVMYNGNCVMKQDCAAKLEMPQCGANARFEECGSACPTTCDTLLYGSNVVCTEQCVPSCVCNEGYVMQNGNCVMKQACVAKETPVCGAHSKFEECGSACPATCETLLSSSHVSCIEECVPQCVCDEGYVMYNGNCVMKQDCAAKLEMPQCGANARFEECGSACPTTCDTLLYGSNVVCIEQCVPSCVCNEGYVMQNGNCVMKQACVAKETPVCGAHSKFEECGSVCPATCETLLFSSHVSCIEECVPQCVCDEGFVMYNGNCVMKQDCAAKLEMPQCGANAKFEECGSACPTTCDTLLYGSNVVCTEQCVPSCVCNEGYVMQNGNCVMKQACVAKETPVCGAHSKFEECGSACPATCETLLSSSHVSCIEECVPQCVCDEGYVMYNGDCVMKQECAAQCGANARFEECGSACPTTCETLLYGSNVVCTEQCVPSCVCNEGFVRRGNNCVAKQECSKM